MKLTPYSQKQLQRYRHLYPMTPSSEQRTNSAQSNYTVLLQRLTLFILREIAFPIRLMKYLRPPLMMLVIFLWTLGTTVSLAAIFGTLYGLEEFAKHQFLPYRIRYEIGPIIAALSSIIGFPFLLAATALPARLSFLYRPRIPALVFLKNLPTAILFGFKATIVAAIRTLYAGLVIIALSIAYDAIGTTKSHESLILIYRSTLGIATIIVANIYLAYLLMPLVSIIGMYEPNSAVAIAKQAVKHVRIRLLLQISIGALLCYLVWHQIGLNQTIGKVLVSSICWYFMSLVCGTLTQRVANLETEAKKRT